MAYLSEISKDKKQGKEIYIKCGHQINRNGKYKLRFISNESKQYNIDITIKKKIIYY